MDGWMNGMVGVSVSKCFDKRLDQTILKLNDDIVYNNVPSTRDLHSKFLVVHVGKQASMCIYWESLYCGASGTRIK